MATKSELRTGIFVILAILVLGLSIWVLGRERNIFGRQLQFFTAFSDVKGLSPGAPVRLGGISIGRVDTIKFAPERKDPKVYVEFLINDDYLERVRKDTKVSIQTQGLLGDRFLNLSLGTGEPLTPGQTLESTEEGDVAQVLQKAGTVVNNIADVSDALAVTLKKIETESLDDIADSFKSLAAILAEVKNGQGFLHRLVYSKKTGDDIVGSLESASKDIASITKQVDTGSGFLHSLIYDPEGKELITNLSAASKKLSETAAVITELTGEIKTGEGLLHHSIYGKSPEGFDQILAKLNDTATNLKEASDALARGNGTLGALLVDSQLYDNMVEVTDGAKRSFILKQAIKNSLAEKETEEQLVQK